MDQPQVQHVATQQTNLTPHQQQILHPPAALSPSLGLVPPTPVLSLTAIPAPLAQRCHALHAEAQLRRQRQQYRESLTALDTLLSSVPGLVDGWVLKGEVLKATKDPIGAASSFQRALAIHPQSWSAHDQLGQLYKESDLFSKAMEEFRLAIDYGPPNCVAHDHLAVVLTDHGTRLKIAGQSDQAIESYQQALTVHPTYWPAHFNLGVVYSERREFDKAMKHYQMAVERNPSYVEALCNIGVIYKNSGELSLAIEYYDRALKSNPNFTIANSNLAIALTDMGTQVKNEGKLEEGIQYYKRALHHHSKYPAAWYNLGVAYAEKCRFDDAKVCYEMAVLFDNHCAEAFNNLGVIMKDRGNLDQAIHYYGLALQANPKFSQTMNNLGVIYTMLGKLDEAHDYCSRAIKTNPLYAEAHNNLGVLYRDEGRINEAISAYEECLKIDPHSRNAGQNRLLAMNSLVVDPTMENCAKVAAQVWEAHRQWGKQFAKLFDKQRYREWEYIKEGLNLETQSNGNLPHILAQRRPLRIGYVSGDFFTHSVSYFIEAPLTYADPSRTHITCYSNVARRDKKTAHLQNLAHAWRTIHDQTAKQVAEQMRKDKIDILIELTGHTAGNRLDVMALKPAPVQITWIGYPNTTGLETIDYRFSDAIVDPIDTPQQYSEELICLPGPFLCYTPPSDAPAVSSTPALTKGYVTFGSFNNLAKVNDRVLQCWVNILKAVPGSRMLIKCKPFASPTVCNKMWQRFAELGIDSGRVDLVSLLPTTTEHLDSYSSVDISVDTFPYAGTTTTCEALYMGVPVVTYQRIDLSSHAHNVGATLLHRIEGMEKLIAHSEEEYVRIAVNLAQDVNALQSLRQRLRPSMLASPLCDGRTFTDNLTTTLEQIWARYTDTLAKHQSNGTTSKR